MKNLTEFITIATVKEDDKNIQMHNYIDGIREEAMDIIDNLEGKDNLTENEWVKLEEANVKCNILAEAEALEGITVAENVKTILIKKYVF